MTIKAKVKFRKGETIRHKESGVVCRCLSIDTYGDIIYVLGEELYVKGAHRFLRYDQEEWESVQE